MPAYLKNEIVGYVIGILGVLAVAHIVTPLYPEARVLTWGNTLLVIVLLVALGWGMKPAFAVSVLGALYVYRFEFHVRNTEVTIGLVVFLLSSITVSQLSTRLQRRAIENERLNAELRAAFEQTSQMEAIKRSEQFKSALLDSVTHDLRTPLTSIKGASTAILNLRNSTAISREAVRESENSLFNIIVQQSSRLDRFIQGMIELATLESGDVTLSGGLTSVYGALDAALARAAEGLRRHKVVVECEEDLLALVSAKAITEVAFSLLENAGKYAPAGSTIRLIARQKDGDTIEIAVEDEGTGVPRAMRDRVFDKFFRGNNVKESHEATGLGLGLAIARGIAEAYGGRIWVEERPDGKTGARFVFTVPLGIRREVPAGEPGVECG